MLTKKQKDCRYCRADDIFNGGWDFSDDDSNCRFKITSFDGRHYHINVWSEYAGAKFDVDSEQINYCPMCGRKLTKETT